MGFSGIGIWEIVLIFVVIIIVIGPHRLPEIALEIPHQIGMLVRAFVNINNN